MNTLFVYGIFLGEDRRKEFGMSNPDYDTVQGYVTWGNYIVEAVPAHKDFALTGLVVDVDPNYWEKIDRLERGYDRIIVTTNSGITAYMYVSQKENNGKSGSKSNRKDRKTA